MFIGNSLHPFTNRSQLITHGPAKKIKQSNKSYGYICDDCKNIFYCSCDIENHRCKVCVSQCCDNCVKEHYINIGGICIRGIYNFKKHSIKRIKNWPLPNIQICCPKCNKFNIEDIKIINPFRYICRDCTRNSTLNLLCTKKPTFAEYMEYKECSNNTIILYTRVQHLNECFYHYVYMALKIHQSFHKLVLQKHNPLLI